ncbi:MAG: hypothetical protein E7098_00985 [Mediterranea massiliensis]|nr:hypothetical protein [Mediterranea massiliensis]
MKVLIDNSVHLAIQDFYEYAKKKYISLDSITVIRKINRIYEGLYDLGKYAFVCPTPRLRKDWLDLNYKECIIEDFHFAFQIYSDDDTKEYYVYVHDVCHSLTYHE